MNSDTISTGLDHHLAGLWPHGVFEIRFATDGGDSEPLCVYSNPVGEQLVAAAAGGAVRPARDIFPDEIYQKICALRDDAEEGPYDKVVLEQGEIWLMFQFLKSPDGVIVTAQDVTNTYRAEQERDRLIARLQESNRELENFAYVASHDLREPTRKIIAFGERLSTKYGPALEGEGKIYLDRMVQAANRMQLLVDNLLSFSRVSRPDQEFGTVDLERIKESVLSNLEIQIAKTGAQISWEPLPSVKAFGSQMEQLFQNLLSNALKFHLPGEAPRIEVRAQAGLADNLPAFLRPGRRYIRLEFRDHGIGFEASEAERIFQLLERLHGRSEYEGSGIGLAICKKIVEHHQGWIYAESSPGEGANFVVWLPEAQENLPE